VLDNPSRLGNVLLEFLIANPSILDPMTAYNAWARRDKQKYGFQKTQRAIMAMRYLNVFFRHPHDELIELLAIETKFDGCALPE